MCSVGCRRLAILSRCLLPLLLLASSLGVSAQCLPGQSAALIRLKQRFRSAAVKSNSTSPLSSWREGTDCCRGWVGVTCEASGRVVALDLSHSFISGTVDPALFDLTSLRSLNLSCNQLDAAPMPSAGFEMLSNLTHLNLSDSGFSGQIPAAISRLRDLVSLDLSVYHLCSLSNLSLENPNLKDLVGGLANLQELYLDGVNIPAAGDEWGRALSSSAPKLRELSLSGCSLSGPIHPSFSNLTSLTFLRLDQNNLSTAVPEFLGGLAPLRFLHLSSCGLYGQLPGRIFALRSLRTLDLSRNPLSGRLPDFPADSVLEKLLLSETNLSGNLPDSVGMLKSLKTLNLAHCNFSGSVPASFGNLSQLVTIDLSINNFSGQIPSFASSLAKIDLSSNSLTGPVHAWLFGLPSLQTLQLNSNWLSGSLSEFDPGSPLLESVDLSRNKLEGPIPRSISKLRGVKILRLASNRLNGTVELGLFDHLGNLSILDLSGNMLTVKIVSSVSLLAISTLNLASCNLSEFPNLSGGQAKTLSRLDLSNNAIAGVIPDWLWDVSVGTLVYMNLSHNSLTGFESPPDFSSQTGRSLKVLDLRSNRLAGPIPKPPPSSVIVDYSDNRFTSALPSDIGSSTGSTIFFSASGNSLTGEIPESICNSSYLQVLDLSFNNFTGKIPKCLLSIESELRVLNLRGNSFGGGLPGEFGQSCMLRTLNLNGNRLEGALPQSLSNCTMLQVLDVGNNRMGGQFPRWLGGLSELRVLVLRSNRFGGSLPTPGDGNTSFSMLQILDISSNLFGGPLPSACFKGWTALTAANEQPGIRVASFDFLKLSHLYYQDSVTVTVKGLEMTLTKILTIFTTVDLSNNSFLGSIPEAVGQLKALRLLNLSFNGLTGRIPSSIGNLRTLESFDLSNNKLSGNIPLGLADLSFLAVLNLSNNGLEGHIPRAKQFLTFSDASFAGNEALCGMPLPRKCPDEETNGNEAPSSASNSMLELNWEYIFVGLGFGGGLALVLVPFVVWSEGRRWFNKHVDRLLSAVVPTGLWIWGECQDVKVDAEEKADGGASAEEEDDDPQRHFCVFCTQLVLRSNGAFIRHVECTCACADEER